MTVKYKREDDYNNDESVHLNINHNNEATTPSTPALNEPNESTSLLPTASLPPHYTMYYHEDGMDGSETPAAPAAIAVAKKEKKSNEAQAFFNIIKANIGSGILGMPFAFMHSGILLGLVVLVILGVVACCCTLMLISCKTALQERYPEKNIKTYGDVGLEVFGRMGSILIDIMLVFTQTGFCVAYLIFIGGNMASLLSIVGGWVYICIALLILVPIILLRNMRYLAPFSLLSEVAIFLGMGIVYYYDILHIRSFDDFLQVKMADPWNFPIFFGITVYSFEGIGLALPVHGSMKRPHRFKQVLISALSIYGILLATFGLLGYVAFKEKTEDVVSLNLPNNVFSIIVKIGLIIGLLFTYPVQLFPVSELFDTHMTSLATRKIKSTETEIRFRKYFQFHIQNLFRIFVLVVTGLLAIVGSDFFGLVLSLIGGMGGSALAFVFPALIHMRVFWEELRWYWILADCTIVVIGVAGGITTSVMSIQAIISAIIG